MQYRNSFTRLAIDTLETWRRDPQNAPYYVDYAQACAAIAQAIELERIAEALEGPVGGSIGGAALELGYLREAIDHLAE